MKKNSSDEKNGPRISRERIRLINEEQQYETIEMKEFQ